MYVQSLCMSEKYCPIFDRLKKGVLRGRRPKERVFSQAVFQVTIAANDKKKVCLWQTTNSTISRSLLGVLLIM